MSASPAVRRIALPDRMDTKAAPALFEALGEARGGAIDLAASNVAYLGAQCFQVLAAAAETWRRDDAAFAIVEPSEAFLEGLARLGAQRVFPFDPEAAQ